MAQESSEKNVQYGFYPEWSAVFSPGPFKISAAEGKPAAWFFLAAAGVLATGEPKSMTRLAFPRLGMVLATCPTCSHQKAPQNTLQREKTQCFYLNFAITSEIANQELESFF